MSPLSIKPTCLLLCVLAASLLPGREGLCDERGVAAPLLAAPINATWAANHAEQWHEKGFRGFLFEGILDDLRLFPSEEERLRKRHFAGSTEFFDEDNTAPIQSSRDYLAESSDYEGVLLPGDWQALTREITGAANRLRAAGIEHNFLHMNLAPDAAWYTDPFLLDIAEKRFEAAGHFCRAANLRGIALNTHSNSLMHDFRWDGHPAEVSPEHLSAGAFRFARRALRAFIRACPEGEILLIAKDIASAGPLWFSFVNGARNAPGAAETTSVLVVLLEPPDIREHRFFKDSPASLESLLNDRAEPFASRTSTPALNLAFSLEPVRYEGSIPTARHSLEVYRRALYAAALYGKQYVLIWAPEGGWWQIPPDTAEQFMHLRQGGAARVRFAPPVPRTLDAYAPRILMEGSTWLGSSNVSGSAAEVLKNDKGAALLIWDGTQSEIQLPSRKTMVILSNVCTDDRIYLTPRDGTVTIPALPGPMLIEGMPLRDYALPASLWMDVIPALNAGVSRSEVVFGVHNPLSATLRGALSVVSDTRYALGASSFSIYVAPGESTRFRRTLRGISHLGNRLEFNLSLNIAADAPEVRTFSFPVAPELEFKFFADAGLSGPPVYYQEKDARGVPVMFLCDHRGRLACFNLETNREVWQLRLSGRHTLPLLLVRDHLGNPGIVTASEQGRLRLFNLEGEERLLLLWDDKRIHALAALNNAQGSGDVIIVGEEERLSLYDTTGQLLHRMDTPGRLVWMTTHPSLPDSIFLVTAGALERDGALPDKDNGEWLASLYDRAGNPLWTAPLSNAVSCSPVYLDDPAAGNRWIVLGHHSGSVTCFNLEDGSAVMAHESDSRLPISGMTGMCSPLNPPIIFYTDNSSVNAVLLPGPEGTDTPTAEWSLAISQPTAMAPLPASSGIVLGTGEGSLFALDRSGGLLWEDHRGTGPTTHIVCLPAPDDPNRYACVVADAHHCVCSLVVRRDLLSPRPLHLERLLRP